MALEQILDERQHRLLADERKVLGEVREALAQSDALADDLRTLADSIAQLDELFLLVVVGEFNAGKSALINALLGEPVLAEGVTPTTTRINLVRYGEASSRETVDEVTEELTHPAPLLRDLTIVDTPGTNALDRRHEAITAEFVPRADLVVFVTSADRPFSESERVFLERIRQWGKKIVVVLNKIDILKNDGEIDQVVGYITHHSRELLDMTPPVFPVSAQRAERAQAEGDEGALNESGLPSLESHLHDTLDESGRIALKLSNPLGVATNLLEKYITATEDQLSLLADDLKTIDDISRQLEAYAEDVDREFRYRLSDMDNLLLAMEKRGNEFFDDRVRLRNLPELLKSDRVRADFEREVVGDTPQKIEQKVDELIEWLVDSDLRQWQSVVQHVNRRRSAHADRIVGDAPSRFESNRAGLLDTIGRAAREGVGRYDRTAEAQRIAESVQKAVASTALVEVGAVGLGATIALLASGSAADVTGLVAAGTMAAIGLFILPHRRRRAKQELSVKIDGMRRSLMETLAEQFANEAIKSRARIRETIAPYDRFVRAEKQLLEGRRDRLSELSQEVGTLQAEVDGLVAGS
jgi:small GTP-binding protein